MSNKYNFDNFPFDDPDISKGLAKVIAIFLWDVDEKELKAYADESTSADDIQDGSTVKISPVLKTHIEA